jgi:hypothetical protein
MKGGKGQVYKKAYPKSRFKQDSLAKYAAYDDILAWGNERVESVGQAWRTVSRSRFLT